MDKVHRPMDHSHLFVPSSTTLTPPDRSPTPRALRGAKHFVRTNPKSDRFPIRAFHHLEFYCGDATAAAAYLGAAMGLPEIARSDLSTGNCASASRVLRSGDITLVVTAPALPADEADADLDRSGSGSDTAHLPGYSVSAAHAFIARHGTAVRAVGVAVACARTAFEEATKHGAKPVLAPTRLIDRGGSTISTGSGRGGGGDDHADATRTTTSRTTSTSTPTPMTIAEIMLYPDSDVVLRFVSGGEASVSPAPETTSTTVAVPDSESGSGAGPETFVFMPRYRPVTSTSVRSFGLRRIDHVVGNVPRLLEAVDYVAGFTGMHPFAEFTAEDVGTVDSGLNSMVLASNEETVLLPINEPTFGTRRPSQIQTYLDRNRGPGVQHVALKTDDIISTLRCIREQGGLELMAKCSPSYYRDLPERIGPNVLTKDQFQACEELGILVDRDDQGILMQIFSKPIGDRATFFFEFIQRICPREDELRRLGKRGAEATVGGCGGFGKGNFTELFKSIEDHDATLAELASKSNNA